MKFMKNIQLIARSADLFREEELKNLNIGGCQAKYLLAVAREPGISQEELSRSLFVNKSNVARQIEALERAGFVRREENERDRRAVLVFPTAKLEEALPRIREVFAAWRALVTEGFTEEERETLARLTGKMVENARRYMEGRKRNARWAI